MRRMRFRTSLGNIVNNRWDYWTDEILKYLYDSHNDFFDQATPPLEDIPVLAERIAQALDLPVREVGDILEYLREEKLVKRIYAGRFYYRISTRGIAEVEKHIYG